MLGRWGVIGELLALCLVAANDCQRTQRRASKPCTLKRRRNKNERWKPFEMSFRASYLDTLAFTMEIKESEITGRYTCYLRRDSRRGEFIN
ncbi:uncharacterized protein M421DRAFT_270049 [Didymella exigua CBS 183.55]|uniref:Ig-like domain-containing protein n=1 Tax=Didymella exigua CBS 183.55 TaxID=1150837 RepID=A0A6A5RBR7_9PLEO|nr:uncharacterized protein M421DRAFT_270049 [Didymella exigua CBS 183.55]KAF1924953.1 hypothetical protein M421DRAFT_270049 [Didymella exigua CBS 183.55]